jgi:hypothetical protein
MNNKYKYNLKQSTNRAIYFILETRYVSWSEGPI